MTRTYFKIYSMHKY